MKEFKDDLEKTVESLRAALREQEQSADKYKEENWNQEVTIQELRTQQTELQSTAQRLEGEQKKLTKVLQTTRESADHYKNEVDRLQTASEEQKQKHDTSGAQYRRQIASLQRQIFDLQQTNETTKAELVKAQRKSPRFLSPTTPNGLAPSEAATPANGDADDLFSTTGGASTHNRKRMDTSGLFPLEDFDYADESPDVSPSRPFLAPNHPSNEIEVLQQRLVHAQRQISTLKGSLQREKEMRIDYKRKLDATVAKSDIDDDEEEAEEEAAEETIEETKPRRLTPYRSTRGGRGRGRGRGGLSLMQRLATHSPSSEYGIDEKDDNDSPVSPVPPVPPLPSTFQREDDEPKSPVDEPPSPTPPAKSNRTSVDGMDPDFANVLRRSSSSRSFSHSPSPFRHSAFARPTKVLSRRSRGGAAYQQARPPSFAGEPEALANELGQLLNGMDNAETVPEAAKETMDACCQTDFEEPSVPALIVTQPSAPVLPSVSEFGVQVDPEPVPVPEKADASLQTEEEPVAPRVETGIQHEDLTPRPTLVSCSVETEPEVVPEVPATPRPTLVSCSVETEPELVPEPPAVAVTVAPPAPVLAQAEVQTDAPSVVDGVAQTIPEPMLVHLDADTQTQQPPAPISTDSGIQTVEIVRSTSEMEIQVSEPEVPQPVTLAAVEVPIRVSMADAEIQVSEPSQPQPVEVATITTAEVEIQVSAPEEPPAVVKEVAPAVHADAAIQAEELIPPRAITRMMSTSSVGTSVGDEAGDTTITMHQTALGEFVQDDDDGTQTETASILETEEEYVDARQSMSLVTPTESLEDYHSIMTVTDNDFESSDDGESIKASRISSRQGTPSSPPPLHEEPTITLPSPPPPVYESVGVSADLIPEVLEPPKLPPPPPKPVLREMSIQTDEWTPPPPAPAPPAPPASPSPSVFRIGPPSQQFQFISPPPSAGPTTTSLPIVASPSPHAGLRDSSTSFIPRPRTSHSDRRQSIESTLSAAIIEDVVARSRTPSNVTSGPDKTRPPMMMLPPPPRAPPPSNMPPPQFIPEKRQSATLIASPDIPPPRPISPPPPELIQRATTPTFGSVLSIPGTRPFGLRHHGSNLPQPIRQPSSVSSFRSAANTVSRIPQSSPSVLSHSIREREGGGMSTTSLTSGDHTSGGRSESQHSSVSSEHYEQEVEPENSVSADRTARPVSTAGGSTDPAVIHAITQTMIGEFLYKYTRKTIGKGHGEKRHKRFFWVHPYTRTLYWSNADPGSANVSESSAKSGKYLFSGRI